MAHPPNPAGGVAPARATTGQQGGGTPTAQTSPAGPNRKVKVGIVSTVPTPTLHIHNVIVTVVDRDGNPVAENVWVAVSGLSIARQVTTTTNNGYTETVTVPAGATGVTFRAALPNGETDSKDLSAPAAPATPHHHATSAQNFGAFMGSYGWKLGCALCALMSFAFFAGAFGGPYGLDWGESEVRKFALGCIFGVAAVALYYKAFGGGHAPSGGGH